MIDAAALKPGDEVAIYIDGGMTGWYQIAKFEGVTPAGDLMVGGEVFSSGGFHAGRGWTATLHAPTPEIREAYRRQMGPLPAGRRPRAEGDRPLAMAWTAEGDHVVAGDRDGHVERQAGDQMGPSDGAMARGNLAAGGRPEMARASYTARDRRQDGEVPGAESWLSGAPGRRIYRGVKVEDAGGILAGHPGIWRGIRDWIDDPSPKPDRVTLAVGPAESGPAGSPRGIRFIMRAGRTLSEVESSRRISPRSLRMADPEGVTARAARRIMEYLQEDLVNRIRTRMGSVIAPDPQAEDD
jgi:hypothetical protein